MDFVIFCNICKSIFSLTRVDIWRNQCDRRSRKFFCQLRKFLEKQRKMLHNFNPKICDKYSSLHKLRKFVCYFYAKYVISIQAYTYCLNLCATFTQNMWLTLFGANQAIIKKLRSFVANWLLLRFTLFLCKILCSKTAVA